jgi:hypothetical protein
VQALEPELGANGRELLDEAVDLPERPVVRPVRPPTAELVVEDDAAPVAEPGELLEVVVAEPGPSVQAEERDAVALADDPVPDASARDVDEALVGRSESLRLA